MILSFQGLVVSENPQLTGTLTTEIENMNKLGKLLRTNYIYYLIDFPLCIIICIPLLSILI